MNGSCETSRSILDAKNYYLQQIKKEYMRCYYKLLSMEKKPFKNSHV